MKKVNVWEIWDNDKYLGTTSSIQIMELAKERGFKVLKVQ